MNFRTCSIYHNDLLVPSTILTDIFFSKKILVTTPKGQCFTSTSPNICFYQDNVLVFSGQERCREALTYDIQRGFEMVRFLGVAYSSVFVLIEFNPSGDSSPSPEWLAQLPEAVRVFFGITLAHYTYNKKSNLVKLAFMIPPSSVSSFYTSVSAFCNLLRAVRFILISRKNKVISLEDIARDIIENIKTHQSDRYSITDYNKSQVSDSSFGLWMALYSTNFFRFKEVIKDNAGRINGPHTLIEQIDLARLRRNISFLHPDTKERLKNIIFFDGSRTFLRGIESTNPGIESMLRKVLDD